MIIILTIIYAAGCVALGFFLMNKYDKYLNMLEEKNSKLHTQPYEEEPDLSSLHAQETVLRSYSIGR